MANPETTSWNLIDEAARGDKLARERFADCYAGAVRDYLGARWRGTQLAAQVDDATQDVFVECFRQEGALRKADARRGGFRAFLYGVIRNVAMRHEKRRNRQRDVQPSESFDPDALQISEASLASQLDRAWAQMVLREAVDRMAQAAELARDTDARATLRVDLLRLRFGDGLPIRTIAKRWDTDPVQLHRQFTKATKEFKKALTELLTERHPDSAGRIEQELAEIARLLR